MPALHATEDLGVVFSGVNQVIAPILYEQARATSARSCIELLSGSEESNTMFNPIMDHSFDRLRLFHFHSRSHDPASLYLVRCDAPLAAERDMP
jgi:hypothetical protein